MNIFVRIAGIASLATIASTAAADSTHAASPDPNTVYITDLTANGTGCPADSVAAVVTPDGKTMALTYDQFVAQAGPGIPLAQSRKNCIINFVVHVPPGFSYAVVSADYRGYASLDAKVTATQKATYYISGALPAFNAETDLVGPFDDDFVRRDEIQMANVVWSPCGVDSIANVNAQVRVSNAANRSGSGMITTDSSDFHVQQLYTFNFLWKKC